MNSRTHKSDGVKRTKKVRFHLLVFTGNDPRKGWRIPLNEIKYNEQRDEETGYGYFGARYMDHELMTMWLSVDPMADKYPSISPYAYCAWDPGAEMISGYTEDGHEYSKWTVTPFHIDGHPRQFGGNPSEIEFVWHIQPSYSDPSTADKDNAFSYEIKEGIKATWFTIGLKDGKVTFFSGTGSCHSINWEDFKKMTRQE